MGTYNIIKKRLKKLCEMKGISYNHLAELANVPTSTVKNIINGKSRNPGVVTLKKLCVGLNISLAEFFDYVDFRYYGNDYDNDDD